MRLKIIGISGSPVNKGNMETYLAEIMNETSKKGLETETVQLSKLNVKYCTHCNFCITKQKAS